MFRCLFQVNTTLFVLRPTAVIINWTHPSNYVTRIFNTESTEKSDAIHRNAVAQSVWWLGYGLGDRSSIPSRGNENILSLRHRAHNGIGVGSPSFLPNGSRGLFPGW